MQGNTLVRLLVFTCVVAFVVWCIFSVRADLVRIPLARLWHSWDVVFAAVSLSLLNYVLRAFRWHWYLRRLGHTLTLAFSTLTYVAGFAFTLSPGKLGEMVRARYYVDFRIPLQDVAAAIFVERLMDLLAMAVLATLILNVFPHYQGVIWTAAIVVVAGLVVFAIPRKSIARSLKWLPNVMIRAGAGVAGTLANARTLLDPRTALLGFLIGLCAWVLEGVGLGVLGRMISPDSLDASLAIGIYAVAVLIGALSFLPGGLGSTEVVMTALLSAHGYSVSDAVLLTLTCRIVTLWLAVCLGWMAVIVLRRRQA